MRTTSDPPVLVSTQPEGMMTDAAKTANPHMRTLNTAAGEYVMLEQIGKGGMGQVWSANLVKGGLYNACAIKILHGALALTDDARERFLNEARIACQLDHPNIVAVTDMGMLGDAPFIVMNRVDGVDLRKFQERIGEPLDFDICAYITGETLAALAYAHDRTIGGRDAGIVHSDVTPGNVLISSSGGVKLTDFGIARFAHLEATRTRPIGTPRYMSPEQRTGKTPRGTDIFSLGVIFWELLNGSRYLEGYDDHQFTHALLNGHIPDLTRPGVPEWAATLCRQMLCERIWDRPLARDARTIILKKTPHYMLASKKIEELYRKYIGGSRSGMTKLLSTADFIRRATPESSPVKITLDSAFSAPSAPPNERTVADNGEEDAPAVLRRNHTHSEPPPAQWPPDEAQETSETGTDTPLMRAQMRTPVEQQAPQPEPPPLLEALLESPPLLAPERPPASAFESEPAGESTWTDQPPEVEPTLVLIAPFVAPDDEPGPAPMQPSTELQSVTASAPALTSSMQAAPVTDARPRSVALWVVAIGIGILIIAVTVLVGVLLSDRPDNSAAAASPRPKDDSKAEVKPAPAEAEPAAQIIPEVEHPKPAVEPPSDPSDPPSTEEQLETEDLPKTEDASPSEVKAESEAEKPSESKTKPKAPSKPRVSVVFLIPGDTEVEIEVGKTKIKGTKVKQTSILAGSHSVRWRTVPNGPWHAVGKLNLDVLPEGKGHQVRLTDKDMILGIATVGGKGK